VGSKNTRSPKETGEIFAHKASESAAASGADCGESIGAFVRGAEEFSGKKSDEPEKSSGAAATNMSPVTAGLMGALGSLVESENVADMLL
jgi:hypothetical protein